VSVFEVLCDACFIISISFFLNCLDQSRSVDDNSNLVNSYTNSCLNANTYGVYNSNQMQYNTPTEISQHDLQASGKF